MHLLILLSLNSQVVDFSCTEARIESETRAIRQSIGIELKYDKVCQSNAIECVFCINSI